MSLILMHRLAKDDNATRALLEHFRNLLTVAALVGAGSWLTKRPTTDFAGWAAYVQGWILSFIAIHLEYLLVANSAMRLHKAGYNGWWTAPMWFLHGLFVVGGVLTYIKR